MLLGVLNQDKTHLPVTTGSGFLSDIITVITIFKDNGEVVVPQGTSSAERSLASSVVKVFEEMGRANDSRRANMKVTLLGEALTDDLAITAPDQPSQTSDDDDSSNSISSF